MFRVFIVDDEKMIRDGLVKTIPWGEWGIEVAGTADNGKTALKMIRNTRPHIILTDIRMPKMDGLELTKRVREELPAARVVVLSGYDDFSYAQQAIRYGVFDYILKPVWAEELYKVMRKLVKTLDEEFQEKLEIIKLQKEMNSEIEQYVNFIRLGEEYGAFAALDKIVIKIKSKGISQGRLKKVYLELLEWTLEALRKDGFPVNEELHSEYRDLYLGLQPLVTLAELDKWLQEFTAEMLRLVAENRDGSIYHPAIKKALEYINTHYHEELTVGKVSEQVYLSPSYFSHIFKKLRGESFSDYLNKVRVQKAKELLANNLYKVYEVSAMVGYSDYKYFSSVFKKITGLSPTEYLALPDKS